MPPGTTFWLDVAAAIEKVFVTGAGVTTTIKTPLVVAGLSASPK